ncbi:MAG: tetratricopeptide repeat protein [Methylococcales bacterium]|nr:tetratricopeptide repeat protein [Methylococcales bacterium]
MIGCASVSDKKTDPSIKVLDENKAEKEVVIDEIVKSEKITAISPEVLYLLMTAEIAGQRKQYGVSLDGYLQAAKYVDDPKIAERAAKIGLFLKDTKKTDEAVALWLKKDGKNLTARKIAIVSALQGSDKEKAVKHLIKALEDDPAGFETNLMEMVKVLEKDDNSEFIYNVLEDVSTKHPEQSIVFFVQALLAGQLNKQDIAIKKVNTALVLQPNWDKALVLRAQFAAQSGNLILARKDLEKVLEKTPENERVQRMLAQVLVKEDNLDGALKVYQNILDVKPEDGDSQFSSALIYLQQGKDNESIEILEGLVNKPGWGAPASFYLGRIEFKNKNHDRALVWFDRVTQGSFEYEASMAAVTVLLNQKKYSEAESRIEKMTVDFPKQKVNILLLKSEVYSAQKEYQKAFDQLTNGLNEFPDHRDLLYTRALIAERLGKLDVVERDLLKVLKQQPGDANALNALGYTLADRTDRYDEAKKYLNQAIKLNPNEAVIIDSLGWLHFKQGKYTEALVFLRDAYARQPESEIAAHIVEVLWALGKEDEAKEMFDQAYEKAPDDEYLQKIKNLHFGLKK